MSEERGRATLIYYGHNTKELGRELPTPKSLTTNLKLDLRTPAGTGTVRQRMNAQLAWLMVEGGELPVLIDSETGLATAVDAAAFEAESASREGEISEQRKQQSSVLYDVPSREELGHVKELPGEAKKVLKGLGDAWRRRG
jgi:hypothetical protein